MNLQSRKYQLIEQVMQFNESELKKMESLMEEIANPDLSTSLDKAMQQVKQGKTTPHNEVRKKYEKWL